MDWKTRFSRRAKKWFFALGGVAVLIAADHFDITIPGFAPIVTDMLIGLFVAEGVYQASNNA